MESIMPPGIDEINSSWSISLLRISYQSSEPDNVIAACADAKRALV
jgi:hypothetical protein